MKKALDAAIVLVGAWLVAVGFNLFLIPHQLLSGGVSGIAMIIGYFTNLNIGFLYLFFNMPLMIWGLISIGRRFIMISVVSVILTTWMMQILPTTAVAKEPMLAAVFGGVLIGIGSGITLRIGGSSGGFDIVGSILTRKFDFPLGTILSAMNGIVILALGYYKDNWDLALFSMLAIYISGKVVDTVHIRHIKVTAFIVTKNKDQIIEHLLQIPRGVTLIKTEGAYTKQQHDMLMTVTTRYELAELKRIIKQSDPKAFVNIVETAGVVGEFRRPKH
ncbi:YitT family protein [Paenibacillus ferrarius]|uniref:YitT family protein n=1 Tax=Paenibacillus ferrarius TaxID=1469647 RepID=UPI003D2D2582